MLTTFTTTVYYSPLVYHYVREPSSLITAIWTVNLENKKLIFQIREQGGEGDVEEIQ